MAISSVGHPGLDLRLRLSRVIHAAMVGTLFCYALVLYVLNVQGWRPVLAPELVATLRWVIYAHAALLAVAFVVGRRRLLSVDGRLMGMEPLGRIARRSGPETALADLQRRLVILLAISEAIAIAGFVLALAGGEIKDFYALGALGLAGQLSITPRRELWEEVARAGTRAS